MQIVLQCNYQLDCKFESCEIGYEVDVSNEFCFLLSHITGAWLQNINMPVFGRLATLSDALPASSKQCVDISLPLDCGISSGIASFASR